jgi:histidinol-phosphate/aromatic aminotransferase/cobyric acid decarboxylase-like protein
MTTKTVHPPAANGPGQGDDAGDREAVGQALRPETKLHFLASPANPTLRLANLDREPGALT